MSETFIHSLADVQSNNIGNGTRIWQFVVILPGAKIGQDCNICSHCFIENDVVVGDRVTIKSGVQLWDGLRLGDDVFIGSNVSFANDKFPRSKQHPEKFLETIIRDGVSIGAGAVILQGIEIGSGAMVGAGSVVVRSVPPNSIVVGNPASIIGYVDTERNNHNNVTIDINKSSQSVATTAVNGVTLHYFPVVLDLRGNLTVGEFNKHIPFTPLRYFMVFGVPSREVRGEHAHRTCHQFLICVKGSCAVVADDGTKRMEVILDAPHKGLYLPPMTWGIQFKYSADAMLLVFASHYYDATDYIRKYEDFVALVSANESLKNS